MDLLMKVKTRKGKVLVDVPWKFMSNCQWLMNLVTSNTGGGLGLAQEALFPRHGGDAEPLVPGQVPSQLPIICTDTLTLSSNLTNIFFPVTTLLLDLYA